MIKNLGLEMYNEKLEELKKELAGELHPSSSAVVSHQQEIAINSDESDDYRPGELFARSRDALAKEVAIDDDARCDVCRSGEREDGNELVFCDGCSICVHQACY